MPPNTFAKGLPLIVFMVGGTGVLATFVQGQTEAKDHNMQYKSVSKKQHTLEEEHKKVMAKMDIDDYVMVPVPKPKWRHHCLE